MVRGTRDGVEFREEMGASWGRVVVRLKGEDGEVRQKDVAGALDRRADEFSRMKVGQEGTTAEDIWKAVMRLKSPEPLEALARACGYEVHAIGGEAGCARERVSRAYVAAVKESQDVVVRGHEALMKGELGASAKAVLRQEVAEAISALTALEAEL